MLVDAPEMKADFAADEAGAISTLGVGQTRQISPINEQNGGVPSLISYPARPIHALQLETSQRCVALIRLLVWLTPAQ